LSIKNQDDIKILMITVRADYGGGPEHLYRLISKLSPALEIYTACPRDIPYWDKYADLLGEDCLIEIPHRKFTIHSLFKLLNFISNKKINIVHSHGKGAGIYGRVIAMLSSSKCVHTFHGLHIQSYNKLKMVLYKNIEKFLSLFTGAVIAVSQSEYELLLKEGLVSQKKLKLIENSVNIPSLTVPESIFDLAKLKIITISRFDYAKNTSLLISIAEEIKNSGRLDRFEIIILGSGPEETQLIKEVDQKKLNEYILFKGFISDPYKYLIESFCYLSTSRWEGMPLGVLEAMSVGLPVIATDVVGNKDSVQHEITGYLYKQYNHAEAADYLIKLADDKDLWRKFSKASRQIAESRFSIKRMAEETKKVYSEVLSKE